MSVRINFIDDADFTRKLVLDSLQDVDIEIADEPDFLFCGDNINTQMKFWDYQGVRILINAECEYPDFNIFDYAIDNINIDMGVRYLRYPYYLWTDGTSARFERALRRGELNREALNRKFCCRVVSNGNFADPFREEFFDALSKYKTVASGGRYRNNIGESVADKDLFQQGYKFSLAFENESFSGYVTEKIIDSWIAGTIPIYWGAPDIVDEFNDNAFINIGAFPTIDDAINKIIEIDKDPEIYMKMLNQPIVTESSRALQLFERNSAKKFIKDIVLQKPDRAFRRPRFSRGKLIESYFRQNAKEAIYYKVIHQMDVMGEELVSKIKKYNKNHICIYGCGVIGKRLNALLKSNGINIMCFIEAAPRCNTLEGVEIKALDQISGTSDLLILNTVYEITDDLQQKSCSKILSVFTI